MTELDMLLIQIEENRHRKDLTPAEVFETGKKLEKLMATPKGRPKNGESCPLFGKGKTTEKVAAVLGVSGKQYAKLRAVFKSPYADLKEELDRHGKVDRVHRKMARRDGANDFVPTPPGVTLALLEREQFVGSIWEPACGAGDIARLIPPPCHASDLGDFGYGESGVDFLVSSTEVDNIITNPPFAAVIQFKKKALQLARKKVALLMYCRQLGDEVEARTPLKSVYVFDEKIDFEGADIGWKMAWYVWELGYDGPITVTRIRLQKSGREE